MRALLCDPDVLLLCKPAALMKPAHATKIYRALGQVRVRVRVGVG